MQKYTFATLARHSAVGWCSLSCSPLVANGGNLLTIVLACGNNFSMKNFDSINWPSQNIITRSVDSLTAYANNSRTHSNYKVLK